MNLRFSRASAEAVAATAAVISAVNVLVALGLVHLASVHLAVINIGLASVLGIVVRRLLPAEPPRSPADGQALPSIEELVS
jgi:hypothetical protein